MFNQYDINFSERENTLKDRRRKHINTLSNSFESISDEMFR